MSSDDNVIIRGQVETFWGEAAVNLFGEEEGRGKGFQEKRKYRNRKSEGEVLGKFNLLIVIKVLIKFVYMRSKRYLYFWPSLGYQQQKIKCAYSGMESSTSNFQKIGPKPFKIVQINLLSLFLLNWSFPMHLFSLLWHFYSFNTWLHLPIIKPTKKRFPNTDKMQSPTTGKCFKKFPNLKLLTCLD